MLLFIINFYKKTYAVGLSTTPARTQDYTCSEDGRGNPLWDTGLIEHIR